MSELNIFQRMSKVTDEIGPVQKSLTVGTGSYRYKAVAESDILNAVKSAESKNGIYSYPAKRQIVESSVAPDGKRVFVRIETIYRFVNMDKPDEYVEVAGYGDGIDSSDKAPGKAVTYADKYALMKAYKIETGEDLDKTPSDELAGHSALKVRQRIAELVTKLVNQGMDSKDVMAAIGTNDKEFKAKLGVCNWLYEIEPALKKLLKND